MTTKSRVRTAIVGVRCTPDEHANINRAAAARGLSASAYLRDLHEHAVASSAFEGAPELWWSPTGGLIMRRPLGSLSAIVQGTDGVLGMVDDDVLSDATRLTPARGVRR